MVWGGYPHAAGGSVQGARSVEAVQRRAAARIGPARSWHNSSRAPTAAAARAAEVGRPRFAWAMFMACRHWGPLPGREAVGVCVWGGGCAGAAKAQGSDAAFSRSLVTKQNDMRGYGRLVDLCCGCLQAFLRFYVPRGAGWSFRSAHPLSSGYFLPTRPGEGTARTSTTSKHCNVFTNRTKIT